MYFGHSTNILAAKILYYINDMKKLIIIIVIGTMGCRSTRVPNIHTPTKREIKRAMKYSTSSYVMPKMKY